VSSIAGPKSVNDGWTLSYHILTINSLIHDLKISPDWQISDSLQHRLLMNNYIIDRLANFNENPFSPETLLNLVLALSSKCNSSAWPICKEQENT